jgi:hypothetical protein
VNTRNLVVASLVGGVTTTILTNVPILNLVNCLLCAGFWAGAILAVWLYRRQTGTVTLGQGVLVGTVAGIWAGIFGFLLSRIGGAGAEALLQSYSQFLPADSGIELPSAGGLALLADLFGTAFTVFMGVLGGLIGGAIFKTAPPPPPGA